MMFFLPLTEGGARTPASWKVSEADGDGWIFSQLGGAKGSLSN